jgi:GNAT superfamily N-acetyltransferase
MTASDFRAAIRLTMGEEWGFGIRDFRRMLTLQPRGCFVAIDDDHLAGLTTTISYERELGWIGNVVVAENHRRKGIGSSLVKAAVAHLAGSRVHRIGLNSFPEKVSMYERLGFETVDQFATLSFLRRPSERALKDLEIPFSRILIADRSAFGADRSKLLRCLLKEFPKSWAWVNREPSLSGYAVVKQYRESSEIGPAICQENDRDMAVRLLRSSIALTTKWPLELSIPLSNKAFLEAAIATGFRLLRKGVVMRLRRLMKLRISSKTLAFGFLDKG